MSIVIVNQSQVPELLPMGECIQVMEEVLAQDVAGPVGQAPSASKDGFFGQAG